MSRPTWDPGPRERAGVPRWAKVVGIIVAVVILLAIVMMVAGGGGGHRIPDHGLGRPDTPAVAAAVDESPAPADGRSSRSGAGSDR
jgi:hypothetical protein